MKFKCDFHFGDKVKDKDLEASGVIVSTTFLPVKGKHEYIVEYGVAVRMTERFATVVGEHKVVEFPQNILEYDYTGCSGVFDSEPMVITTKFNLGDYLEHIASPKIICGYVQKITAFRSGIIRYKLRHPDKVEAKINVSESWLRKSMTIFNIFVAPPVQTKTGF